MRFRVTRQRGRRQWLRAVGAVWLSGLLAFSVMAGLPGPTDLPPPPPGEQGAGLAWPDDGVDRPREAAGEVAGGVAVAMISPDAMPGRSVLVTGRGLEGATFTLWMDGRLMPVKAWRLSGDRGQLLLPGIDGQGRAIAAGPGLLWAAKEGQVGEPIRVAGPDVWWVWPVRVRTDAPEPLRLFGRNFGGAGGLTRVLGVDASGDSHELASRVIDGHRLEAELPVGLPAGALRVWVHVGAGAWGWSWPVELTVVAGAPKDRPTVEVHPPIAGGTLDDALDNALTEAQRLGGATVQLPAGRFTLERPIVTPASVPIDLLGAGEATQLTIQAKADRAVNLLADGCSLRDLKLIVPFGRVALSGSDQTVQRVIIDRPAGTPPATTLWVAPGTTNTVIEGCTFYATRHAIHLPEGVEYVRISDCEMVGRYHTGSGTDANAIQSFAHHLIVERNHVTSEDRPNGRLFCRFILQYLSDSRGSAILDNHIENLGPHPSVTGIDPNTKEVILFHARGSGLGHLRTPTTTADGPWLELDPPPPAAVKPTGGWLAMVVQGPGLGQWRTITGRDGPRLRVDRPWRLPPGPPQTLLLFPAFRHHLVLGNTIDLTNPHDGPLSDAYQRIAIQQWFAGVDNVFAHNRIINAHAGVGLFAQVQRPIAWTTVEHNTISGPTVPAPDPQWAALGLYTHNHAPTDQLVAQFYTLGNVFRDNQIARRAYGVRVGWVKISHAMAGEQYRFGRGWGMIGDLIESNRLDHVDYAATFAPPANETLYAHNTEVEPEPPAGRLLYVQKNKVRDLLIIP